MSSFLHRFRLNLGLKRVLIDHPVASKALTLLKPRRLRLPVQTLDAFLNAPPPVIAFRQHGVPPVNTGPRDLVPLCSLARAIDARRILEVGCHVGAGTLSLALACPDATIVTYDIKPDAGRLIEGAEPALRDRIERRITSFPTDRDRLQGEPAYDFIYIDGDHTHAGVKADTELALTRLAPGGIIAWHDYCHRGHEWVYGTNRVPEYLNTLAERLPLRHIAGSWMVAWQRPRA